MTVSSTSNEIRYDGNGVTVAFPFPYLFYSEDHLKVSLIDANGVSTVQTITTDYTVTGEGVDAGGTVTMNVAPSATEELLIQRIVPLTQLIDYVSGGPFPAETHERGLDLLTMIAQQLQDTVVNALRLDDSQTAADVVIDEIASERANMVVGFDENGDVRLFTPNETGLSSIVPRNYTVAPGQTVVTIDSYTGLGSQLYYLNNVPLFPSNGEIEETNSTTVTLAAAPLAQSTLTVIGFTVEAINTAAASNVSYGSTTVQQALNETYPVDSIIDLPSAPLAGDYAVVKSYYANGTVSLNTTYQYNASGLKSTHNGGTIISPTVPWDGVAGATHTAFLAGTGETDPGGSGVWELQRTVFYPSDFGAIDGGSDQYDALAALFAASKNISIFKQYGTSAALFPQTESSVFFAGAGELVATQIITGDECVIKIDSNTNVDIYAPNIDCGSFSGNSGIIVRDNAAEVRINNPKVKNGVWDMTRGGGRAVIVEGNTGTQGRVQINDIYAKDVDTVFALGGYTGSRKNAVTVNGIVGIGVEKLIALFGNGTGYPHTGDTQQCSIYNVVGYDVAQPIRFDRAANAIIDGVYVFNSPTYGSISSVVRGVSSNVKCTNVVYEGDCSAIYDATPWHDDNSATDTGDDTEKSQFEITHRGTCANTVVSAAITRATLVSDTVIDINCDVVTGGTIGNAAFNANTTAKLSIYSANNNSKIEGLASDVGAATFAAWANSHRLPTPFGTFTPVIVGSTAAGAGTYSIQRGDYTIVGNRVIFNLYLTWSAHTGTGSMRIGGLPVTPSTTANTHTACAIGFPNNIALTAGNTIYAHVDPGTGQITLIQSPTGGGAATTVPIDTAAAIMVSGSYLI